MCFSASASFVSAGVLALIGVANLKAIRKKKMWMLASIPLFFAIQQALEGVVWLEANKGLQNTSKLAIGAEYSYLFFAFIVWPLWAPLSTLLIEKVRWRKYAIGLCLLIGMYVVSVDLSLLPDFTPYVEVSKYHIGYRAHASSPEIAYSIAVAAPFILSSFSLLWVFGLLIMGSFLITTYFFAYAEVSVWCFFAAILSTILYKLIKDEANENS